MPGPRRALNDRGAGRLIGGYRLESLLGRGGMAEVWKATLTGPARFARTVAVKRILPHLLTEPHIVKMFGKEAATSGLLHHQNIVQVYELREADGELLIVMEFVAGADLLTLIKRSGGRLPLGFALHVVRELCRGLHHAHTLSDEAGKPLGIVHRDVSHANVMVGWDGAIKLSDFGVAKVLSQATAATRSEVKGKTGYMSPEQASGERVDHRTDVFSVGVVLYELCTGAAPWMSPSASLSLRSGTPIAPPSALVPDLPRELDAICLCAMSDLPQDRFGDCNQLAEALAPLADQHRFGPQDVARLCSQLAPPEIDREPTAETVDSFQLPKRRRWPLIALGAVSLAILIAGLAHRLLSRPRYYQPPPIASPLPPLQPEPESKPEPELEVPAPPVIAPPAPAEKPRAPAAAPARKPAAKKKQSDSKPAPRDPLWDPFGK